MKKNKVFKNILIRGLDGPHSYRVVQNLLEELKPEHCWYIYDPEHYPNRPSLKIPSGVVFHEIPIDPLIRCDFTALNTHILPADEPLLNSMSLAEAVNLKMADRMYMYSDIQNYQRRKWHYLSQISAWNSFIKEKKIDLYLTHVVPHHPVDFITYELLRLYKIPTYYQLKLPIPDAGIIATHWETAGIEIRNRYLELKKQNIKDVKLSSSTYIECFETMSSKTSAPKYTHVEKYIASLSKKFSPLEKFSRLLAKVGRVLKKILSVDFSIFSIDEFYRRKYSYPKVTARLAAYYETIIQPVDWNVKFAYFPLQFQPEATTTPMCGQYMEQLVSIQILSACIPKDWKIYVKEYRAQGSDGRDFYFYEELLKLKNVQFIDKNTSSPDLIRSSQLVATGTGTAGWEAAFQEKPTLLFGHPSYQFIPGVHLIHSLEDCQNAIAAILRGEKPNLADIKLYLKAAEETILPSYNQSTFEDDSKITREENVKNTTQSFLNAIYNQN